MTKRKNKYKIIYPETNMKTLMHIVPSFSSSHMHLYPIIYWITESHSKNCSCLGFSHVSTPPSVYTSHRQSSQSHLDLSTSLLPNPPPRPFLGIIGLGYRNREFIRFAPWPNFSPYQNDHLTINVTVVPFYPNCLLPLLFKAKLWLIHL